jgi:endonuclease/exonuclease/phosphatase family metal-dependent hydrolase
LKFIKKSILALNIVLIIGLLLAYLSPYFDPNDYWIFSMFGLFYPVLLFANIAMVLFWMIVEFKYLFASLITIFMGWSHLQGFVNFSALSEEPGDLTVMTYNANFFYSVQNGTKKDVKNKRQEVSSFFASQKDVDVFCLQESSKFSKDILKKLLPDYHVHEMPRRATFIISRYPIISNGEIDFGTSTNSCIWADIKTQSGKVRIYTAHLQSNRVSKDAVVVLDNANLQEKKTWNGIRGILSKYSQSSRKRAKQAQMIADHAAKCAHKTIIAADVNDPPTSYTYSRLCGDFQDSFVAAGAGIGTTYAGRIPMLRIDYIFADNGFVVESFEVLKESYSDHYPVKGVYSFVEE